MRYLTHTQILYIHVRIMRETGGRAGIRDKGLLDAAIARPMATFEDVELYPDVYSKAAALAESLINSHPFVDGNKRTGITAASMFLRANGFQLDVAWREMVRFTLSIAQSRETVEKIASWLQSHSTPIVDSGSSRSQPE